MNVYEKITQTIIEQIDKGIIPWQRPWTGTADGAINYVTRRPYSILSARDQDNNRLATIEINLPTLSIRQCRGLQNQKPEMYDTINSIIMKHISEIKKRKLKPLAQPA